MDMFFATKLCNAANNLRRQVRRWEGLVIRIFANATVFDITPSSSNEYSLMLVRTYHLGIPGRSVGGRTMEILMNIERFDTSRNRSDMNHRKLNRLLAKINIVV